MASIALECSTAVGSVALRAASGELHLARFDCRTHASSLVDELATLLRAAGLQPSALARIFVGIGPGSYTGLRVAIATALGLSRGSGAGLHAISSYEALAWGELSAGEDGLVLADARAGRLYFARYRRRPDEVEIVEAPRLIEREALSRAWGSPARLFCEPALADALELSAREPAPIEPSARALLELGEKRLASGVLAVSTEVEPLYLRPVQAIERRR
jgi:tRNA threonylcarbamoyl adenosine modification protein YeaZ